MTTRIHLRRGMTLIQTLLVVTIAGIMMAFAVPKIDSARDGAARRAARQELTAAFAATRAAALQKGKTATLTLTSTSALVRVQSGLAGNMVTVWGPLRFDTDMNATLQAISGAPLTVSYNARGMLTPTPASILKYRLTVGSKSDTLCISTAGMILPKECQF